jgi:hypothetical protein
MKVYGTYRIVLPSVVCDVIREEDEAFCPSLGFSEVELFVLRHQTLPIKELALEIIAIDRVVEVKVVNWDRQGILLSKRKCVSCQTMKS